MNLGKDFDLEEEDSAGGGATASKEPIKKGRAAPEQQQAPAVTVSAQAGEFISEYTKSQVELLARMDAIKNGAPSYHAECGRYCHVHHALENYAPAGRRRGGDRRQKTAALVVLVCSK